MSILSNTHCFSIYDPKKSKPADETQRLLKIGYKTEKGSGIKKDTVCASVPLITNDQIKANMDGLMDHFRESLEVVQNAIARKAYEEGATSITTEQLSLSECITWIDTESGRLTKESVEKWFDSSISDVLTVAFSDKLGISDNPTPEQEKKVQQMVAGYRGKIASLAGGKTAYTADVADKLLKVLELASDDDAMAGRFVKRLEKMKEEQEKDADLLGL